MKAIALLTILAVASLKSSLLLAAEPAPSSDQPAAKATPAKAGQPDERATGGADDTDSTVAEGTAAKDKVAPEKSQAEKSSAEKSAAEKSDDPGLAKSAADKASPQRFVPSEQVRADFDVSFPIDM